MYTWDGKNIEELFKKIDESLFNEDKEKVPNIIESEFLHMFLHKRQEERRSLAQAMESVFIKTYFKVEP